MPLTQFEVDKLKATARDSLREFMPQKIKGTDERTSAAIRDACIVAIFFFIDGIKNSVSIDQGS